MPEPSPLEQLYNVRRKRAELERRFREKQAKLARRHPVSRETQDRAAAKLDNGKA